MLQIKFYSLRHLHEKIKMKSQLTASLIAYRLNLFEVFFYIIIQHREMNQM